MHRIGSSQLFILLFCVAIALAACGGSGEQEAAGPADSADARASAEPGESGPSPTAASGAHPELGAPLDHPKRYYGLYANPQTPDRQWFVAEARRPKYAEQAPEVPPGHLAMGAMFGDVAPWHMKTLSPTEFEQAWVSDNEPAPVTVEFELDGDGEAVAMTFTDERFAPEGRLERQGDLPDNWQ